MTTLNNFFNQTEIRAVLEEIEPNIFNGKCKPQWEAHGCERLDIDLMSSPISTSASILIEPNNSEPNKVSVWLMLDTHEGIEGSVESDTNFFLGMDKGLTRTMIETKLYKALGKAQLNLEQYQRFTQKFNGTKIDRFVGYAHKIINNAIEFNRI